MKETVSLDSKGRLVLPKRVRLQAGIEVNHDLVARAIGVGRIELLDPSILLAKAQEIGAKKLAGWKETDHEASAYLQRSVKKR
jgi:bifunctional DNA-binding transcriptional regulator/antitoxin component of YhaV-PrlF toxin-antitoxin module